MEMSGPSKKQSLSGGVDHSREIIQCRLLRSFIQEYEYSTYVHLKIFIAKRVNSILVNLRYLRFKLLKYKENKNICNTFNHNFKHIPLYE